MGRRRCRSGLDVGAGQTYSLLETPDPDKDHNVTHIKDARLALAAEGLRLLAGGLDRLAAAIDPRTTFTPRVKGLPPAQN